MPRTLLPLHSSGMALSPHQVWREAFRPRPHVPEGARAICPPAGRPAVVSVKLSTWAVAHRTSAQLCSSSGGDPLDGVNFECIVASREFSEDGHKAQLDFLARLLLCFEETVLMSGHPLHLYEGCPLHPRSRPRGAQELRCGSRLCSPGWIDKHNVCVCLLDWYSAPKRKEILAPAATGLNLEDIAPREMDRYRMIDTVWFHPQATPGGGTSAEMERGWQGAPGLGRRWAGGSLGTECRSYKMSSVDGQWQLSTV